MSRKSGAQAGEGKLESRFAALTSGLLARKGQAAPSNSPIVDPADETEAFTPGNALIPRKNAPKENKVKPPALSPLSTAPRAASISSHSSPALQRPATLAQPAKPAAKPAAAPTSSTAPKPQTKVDPSPTPSPITIINERSFEAGYPNNPTAEEIAAIEAEADEVVTYFENFGAEEADDSRDRFFDDESAELSTVDPLDDLDDAFSDLTPLTVPAGGDAKPGASADVRATVIAELNIKEFMRLSLGAAELRLPAAVLIAEAIEEYLDARGVDSLGGEEYLKKLAALSGGGAS